MASAGVLHVVALPLGNLGDITQRARETLKNAQAIYAEDTRSLQKLSSLLGLGLHPSKIHSLDTHHEARKTEEVIRRVLGGEQVALVSEAGTPGVSDPGARVVAAVRGAGGAVAAVPGPSILCAALSLSGHEGPVAWLGFAPRKGKELLALVGEYPACSALFFLESPRRLRDTLSQLQTHFVDTPVMLFHELTKLHEEVLSGAPGELLSRLDAEPKGEWALMLMPRAVQADGEEKLAQALALTQVLKQHLPPSTAAKVAAQVTGVPKNKLYGA